MKLFAVSDLHLSLQEPYQPGQAPRLYKPMEVFGPRWADCFQRLDDNWRACVAPEDTVLLAGDLSWAMSMSELQHDFEYLGSLPGRKIIVKGNHDFWWSSVSRVRALAPKGVEFLQHSAAMVGGLAVCGTRGWLSPRHADFREFTDQPIYKRELIRLRLALEDAAAWQLPILALLHYPPLLHGEDDSEMADLLEEFSVRRCIYGHIHGDKQSAFEGERNGVVYINSSMDRLEFCPLLLAEDNKLLDGLGRKNMFSIE